MIPLSERFWKFVDKSGDCWLWTGTINGAGYGTIGLGRKADGKGFAHRVSWELANGPIPNGLLICHRCDCKICVNPDHLFLGTHQDNVNDMIRKGRNNVGRTPARIASQPKGESHGRAKLTEPEVKEIIRGFYLDNKNKAQLAKQFGVSRATVRNIIKERNWKNVSKESALAGC